MMEVTLLGFGVLALIVSWKFMLQPSMVDTARDKLFDLRDEARAHFATSEHGLLDPSYLALRQLLNGYIRYTEAVTLFRLTASMVFEREHAEAFANAHRTTEQQIHSDNPDVNKFIKGIRESAALIVLDYAIKSSLFGLLCLAVSVPVVLLLRFRSVLRDAAQGFPSARAMNAAACSVMFLLTIQPGIAGRNSAQAVMEEHALHTSAA